MGVKLEIDRKHNTEYYYGVLANKHVHKHLCYKCNHNGMDFTSRAGIPCEYAFTPGLLKCPGYYKDKNFSY